MLLRAFGKHLYPCSVKRGRNGFAFISRHGLSVEGEMDLLTAVKGKDRMLVNPHFHMSFRKNSEFFPFRTKKANPIMAFFDGQYVVVASPI